MSERTSIATALRFALEHSADDYVTAEPEPGLHLQLSHKAGTLYLVLRRESVHPTIAEAQAWTEAFGVPNGIDDMVRRSWKSTHPKTQRPLRWCALTFNWREIPD